MTRGVRDEDWDRAVGALDGAGEILPGLPYPAGR